MDEYKSNSHKSRAEEMERTEEKKLEKVISGTAKVKKPSPVSKFISEDIANVKTYILSDVLIPAAKKLVSDIVKDGIEMILYGTAGQRKRTNGLRADYVSYDRFSDRRDNRDLGSSRRSSSYRYDEIVLDSRGDAEEVLDKMDEIIDAYGMVSVADLYEIVGMKSEHTDNKYGWTNIRNAEPTRTRDGYVLNLPKVTPLK